MSKYVSTVSFRVKDGHSDEFVARHEAMNIAEATQTYIIKTGEKTFAFIGIFESEQHLINARPQMIASLDRVRDLLEEISPELGVTDPASGPVVFER